MALAQWMDAKVEKPFDLGDVDISRMAALPWATSTTSWTAPPRPLGLLYADHFPYRQKATARGVRRTPFHHHLLQNGAVMGELGGWERANWIAKEGQEGGIRI